MKIILVLFLTNFLPCLCHFNGTDWCTQASKGTMFGIGASDDSHKIACAIIWPRIIDEKSKSEKVLKVENVFGRSLSIRLLPSKSIFSKDFILLSREKKQNEISFAKVEKPCSFQLTDKGLSGSINICEGLQGVWSINGTTFVVQPLDNVTSLNGPHVVIRYEPKESTKKSMLDNLHFFKNQNLIEKIRERQGKKFRFFPERTVSHFNAMKSFLNSVFSLSAYNEEYYKRRMDHRQNTAYLHNVTIELAIFVDRHLYQSLKTTFPENSDKHVVNVVSAMINAVQILFDDDSLEHKVNFEIKRIELMKDDMKEYHETADIQNLLRSFCKWQTQENSVQDQSLRWDHALLLTGLDLQSKSQDGKVTNNVIGLAPVSGMCTQDASCTVSEGNNFETVFVIAHEFGHNLGMKHDGRKDLNECDPNGYMMSPTLGSGKNTWSICSQRYLEKFLASSQASCLKNPLTPKLSRGDDTKLPGEMFPADVQCKLQFGPKSRHSSMQIEQDICTDLHCTRDHYTWASHSALEGTSCGFGKWCRRGVCTRKMNTDKVMNDAFPNLKASLTIPRVVDGNWTKFSDWSECSCRSGSRLRVSKRSCTNPKPENGGKDCEGVSEKFILCSDSEFDCPLDDHSELVESTCIGASLVDSSILPFGKNNAHNTSSCQIECFKAGSKGGSISKGWNFPDGTKCRDGGDDGDQFYCVRGKCQKFTCDSEMYKLDPNNCQIENRRGQRQTPRTLWTSWKVLSGCAHSCISNAPGLRLVARECLAPSCKKGLRRSVQLCNDRLASSSHHCTKRFSVQEFTNKICSKYKDPRLSGFGVQLEKIPSDPDRACKVSCQDANLSHRFYVVSSQDGHLPPGTPCHSKDPRSSQAYCVMGKCLNFGKDMTLSELSEETLSDINEIVIKPRSLSFFHNVRGKMCGKCNSQKFKRELYIEPPKLVAVNHSAIEKVVEAMNVTHFNGGSIEFQHDEDMGEIAFDDPIDVVDLMPSAEYSTHSRAQAFVHFNEGQNKGQKSHKQNLLLLVVCQLFSLVFIAFSKVS